MKTQKQQIDASVLKVEAVEAFLKNWEAQAIGYYKAEVEEYYKMKVELAHMRWSERQYHLRARFTGAVEKYCEIYNDEKRNEKIVADMAKEVEARRIDLYNRCAKIVGTVTDAIGLRLGNNGSINGFVIGTEGKAEVETIYAGGYNIQCLHYRVLVKKA